MKALSGGLGPTDKCMDGLWRTYYQEEWSKESASSLGRTSMLSRMSFKKVCKQNDYNLTWEQRYRGGSLIKQHRTQNKYVQKLLWNRSGDKTMRHPWFEANDNFLLAHNRNRAQLVLEKKHMVQKAFEFFLITNSDHKPKIQNEQWQVVQSAKR